MSRHTSFEEIADDLYGRPRLEFVAARDAASSEARSAGDAGLAAALRKLRRPTASAWLANALVRESTRKVAQLVDLGNRVRTAQVELDGAAMRRLTQERHDLVAELSRDARRLARDHGEMVSDATARELEETLEAASLDPRAAEQLRGGRLTSGLAYSGMGFSSMEGGPPSAERARSGPGRTRQTIGGRSKPGRSARATGPREAGTTTSRQADRRLARQEAREERRAADRAATVLAKHRLAAERAQAALLAAEAEVTRRREAVAAAKRDERRARGELEAAEREARRSEKRLIALTRD